MPDKGMRDRAKAALPGWRIEPAERASSLFVRAPEGPDDMIDPRSPKLEKWIARLPREERLSIMMALAFAYPRLSRDESWQTTMARDRKAVGAHFDQVTAKAARAVLELADAFKAAREAGQP